MARYFFTFSATNFSSKAVGVCWHARVVDPSDFKTDPVLGNLKARPLEVTSLGIVKHRCDEYFGKDVPGPLEKLEMKMAPGERVGLALVVHTRKRYKMGLQMALVAIEEVRDNGLTGGMLVAVTSTGGTFAVPADNLAPKPVPLTISEGPSLQADAIYGKAPAQSIIHRDAGAGYLGFLVKNNGNDVLKSVVFYPESVGIPGVHWVPRLFEIDALEPGGEFFAAFPFDPGSAEEGAGIVRLVGYSEGYDRTRFNIELQIVDPRHW